MLISIRHVTRYTYAQPVGYAIQSLRLTPVSFNGQRVIDWQVRTPGFGPVLQFKDGFGNIVQVATINTPHQEVVIEAGGTVETTDCSGVVAGLPNTSPCRVFLRGDAAHPARCRHPRACRLGQGAGPARQAACAGRHRARPRRLRGRQHGRPHRAPPRRWPTARASARTTPTSSSRPRARWACRPAMSPATSCSASRAGRRRTTPGRKPGWRAWAGSASTSPIASARPSATCASPSASMRAAPRRWSARAAAASTKLLDVAVDVREQNAQQHDVIPAQAGIHVTAPNCYRELRGSPPSRG